MADLARSVDGSDGVAFLVSAGIVYEIIAAACSSPQTTEINVGKRGATLMKWVYIGIAQALGFVVVAAYIDPKHRAPILAGGMIGAGLMFGQYRHAYIAGLAAGDAPATEEY